MSICRCADDALSAALDFCVLASTQQTFAVGGIMVSNSTGEVIAGLSNRVLLPGQNGLSALPHDPTAHVERQLVDWYFQFRDQQQLPEPSRTTIITTLDPCLMCAGAILAAGLNVGAAAIDQSAGVNFDENLTFASLPETLRETAWQTFGYYGIGQPLSRPYRGAPQVAFSGDVISAKNHLLARSAFVESLDRVRKLSNQFGIAPNLLTNPQSLPVDSEVRHALANADKNALAIVSENPTIPGGELCSTLIRTATAARDSGDRFHSVALLDPFGNLLLCKAGAESISPIRTAFMELVRSYSALRWSLSNHPDRDVRKQSAFSLAHPKHCTFVFLFAPDPRTPEGLMELGAYGSTLEGPGARIFPANIQYVLLPGVLSPRELLRLCADFPPFYRSKVKVAPMQVLDEELIQACKVATTG
jgi:tRNA(Arg) A34 adenosine deaminase TadA